MHPLPFAPHNLAGWPGALDGAGGLDTLQCSPSSACGARRAELMTAMAATHLTSTDAAESAERFLPDVDEGDLLLRVTGILPAAEFHPFVVRRARQLGLRGWIRHEPCGALIRAIGTETLLVRLVRAIRAEAPPSARIRSLDTEPVTASLPLAGDHFVALIEEPVAPAEPMLQHVA